MGATAGRRWEWLLASALLGTFYLYWAYSSIRSAERDHASGISSRLIRPSVLDKKEMQREVSHHKSNGIVNDPTITSAAIKSPNRDESTTEKESLTTGENEKGEEEEEEEKEEDSWLSRMRSVQARRKARIRSVCDRMGAQAHWPTAMKAMLVDKQHRVGWCPQAKAGSSTLLGYFLPLSNLVSEEKKRLWGKNPAALHSKFLPLLATNVTFSTKIEDLIKLLEGNFMFSIVRHPYERLASMFDYLDYAGLRRKIGTNFTTFVDHVFRDAESEGCLDSMQLCPINVHWRPQVGRCAYCDVDYDVIGKVETYADDLRYIAVSAGMDDLLRALPAAAGTDERSAGAGGGGGKIARLNSKSRVLSNRTAKYFGELDSLRRERVYRLFRFDFELFGYSPDVYA